MFHVELRQFPRNTHAFNLSDAELRATVLAPWLTGRPFEHAGQRWRPDEARLTILSGPRLEPHQLAMGRGWASALKSAEDVTESLLRGQGGAPVGAGHAPRPQDPASGPADGGRGGRERFDGFKAELLARTVEEPSSPREAWRLAGRWLPSRAPSERLSLAERATRELLAEGLVILGRGTRATASDHPIPPADLEMILLAWESWAEERPGVFLCATPAGAALTGAQEESSA